VVAYCQLVKIGLGRGAIHHRVVVGRLHRLHVGVFAVGHTAVSLRGRWLAAVLACGPNAVLSHRSAAELWELRRSSRASIDVTAPGRRRQGPPQIAVHRARGLDRNDRTTRHRIPVTSVARTLLDLAEVVRPRELARALEEAERLRLFDLRAIEALRERSNGRRGLRPLIALLNEQNEPPPMTRSELERCFLDLCDDAGLPRPAVNVHAQGYEVDALWRNQKLAVELDSRAFHLTRAAFERDRVRDATLQLAGYRVLRITHRRLHNEPKTIADTIRALLATAGS
jgi:hypothetical protein